MNKEKVTPAPISEDFYYKINHKISFQMPPIEKILEQPSAEIPPNHAADVRPNNLTPGQSVKLTRQGQIILHKYSNNIDIHGVFYIRDILLRQSFNGKRETRYYISQNDQRLSFYDDYYNVCLEALTPEEATKLNNQRMIEKSNQEAKNTNYQYRSVPAIDYGNGDYYFDNDIVRLNKRDNLKTIPPQEKTQKAQKTALKGHKFTSMFRS